MTKDNIRAKVLDKMVQLRNCLVVVKIKYKGMPVDDAVNEGIIRDVDIVMDTVDSSLKENFCVKINQVGDKAVVDIIDKTTNKPATGDRVYKVLEESVKRNEGE